MVSLLLKKTYKRRNHQESGCQIYPLKIFLENQLQNNVKMESIFAACSNHLKSNQNSVSFLMPLRRACTMCNAYNLSNL